MFKTSVGILWLLSIVVPAESQVLDVRQLNTRQIGALDPSHTVVLLTGGILEEHGPYLPAFSDGYQSEFIALRIADAIVAKPGWTVLRFPTLALGAFPANEIGGRFVFPGSYAVRSTTLRAVFMDLVTDLGDGGFKYVVLVNLHGGPTHERALDDVAKYFNDTYGGKMLHVTGLVNVTGAVPRDTFTAAQRATEGLSPHADADEHSRVLFVRPDLVAADFASAPALTDKSMDDVVATAKRPGWPGYFGTPAIASAAAGSRAMNAIGQAAADDVLRMLAGENVDTLPHDADGLFSDPTVKRLVDDGLAHERQVEQKETDWLARHVR